MPALRSTPLRRLSAGRTVSCYALLLGAAAREQELYLGEERFDLEELGQRRVSIGQLI